MLSAANITVERLKRTVLRDVTVTLKPGECVSVIGPNGAGKSTLMAALLGLLPVTQGRVELDGRDIHDWSRRQIARRVAYVPQLHEGYLGFRVREVVESGRYAHLDPLEPMSQADREAVEAAITATHIEALLDRPVETLSGGERQKVWIAAALAQASPMLFLDEPTNALDPAHQAELIRILRAASAAQKTLLVICHDLNLPLALGGRVVALQQGRVLFDASTRVLQETDRLEALFGTRFALHRNPHGDGFSIHLEL